MALYRMQMARRFSHTLLCCNRKSTYLSVSCSQLFFRGNISQPDSRNCLRLFTLGKDTLRYLLITSTYGVIALANSSQAKRNESELHLRINGAHIMVICSIYPQVLHLIFVQCRGNAQSFRALQVFSPSLQSNRARLQSARESA